MAAAVAACGDRPFPPVPPAFTSSHTTKDRPIRRRYVRLFRKKRHNRHGAYRREQRSDCHDLLHMPAFMGTSESRATRIRSVGFSPRAQDLAATRVTAVTTTETYGLSGHVNRNCPAHGQPKPAFADLHFHCLRRVANCRPFRAQWADSNSLGSAFQEQQSLVDRPTSPNSVRRGNSSGGW